MEYKTIIQFAMMFMLLLHAAQARKVLNSLLIPEVGYGPEKIFRHTAQYDPNYRLIFFFGGSLDSHDYSNDIWVFSTEYDYWQLMQPITDKIAQRAGPASFYDEKIGVLYIFGGLGRSGILNDLHIFVVESLVWKNIIYNNEPPSPRAYIAYTQGRDADGVLHLYVYGGITNQGTDDQLWGFNTSTSTWTFYENHGHRTQKRESASIFYINGSIYLFGGHSGFGVQSADHISRYDFETNGWVLIQNNGNGPRSRSYSTVATYEDCLYVMYGWQVPLQEQMDDIWKFNTITQQWSEVEIDKEVEGYEVVGRDSSAYVLVDGVLYMHGGYTDAELSNSLVRLDLSQTIAKWEIVNYDIQNPAPRSNFSFELLSKKVYMFGGQIGNKYMDDLWKYDIDLQKWTILDQRGIRPVSRAYHASTVIGNMLFIWGGVSHSNKLNDLLQFNTARMTWQTITATSALKPNPRQGACMVNYERFLYIIGGLTEHDLFVNEVWQFDLGTFEYTQITQPTQEGPPPGSNYDCISFGEKIVVLNGRSYGTTPIDTIYEFNLHTKRWTYLMTQTKAKDQASVIDVGSNYLILLGGNQWNLWSFNEIVEIDLENLTDRMIGNLPFSVYSHKSIYYKNAVYTFGGGSSLGCLTRPIYQTSDFIKTTFEGYSCSRGCYQSADNNEEWEAWPTGTYAQDFFVTQCSPCPIGTQNAEEGAASEWLCQPCASGTYNDVTGAEHCKDCDITEFWGIGSTVPLKYEQTVDIFQAYVSKQPEQYKSDPEQYYIAFALIVTIWALTTIFVACCLAQIRRFKSLLMKIDMYNLQHNHIFKVPMYVKTTAIGGIFTIIFFVAVLFIPFLFIIQYLMVNVQEFKIVIPESVDKDNAVESFINNRPDVKFSVGIALYGGECVNDDLQWHSGIQITAVNMGGSVKEFDCRKIGPNCFIDFRCEDWRIHLGSKFVLNLQERASYASAINLNVTSFSSIPNEYSFIQSSISAPENTIFRGPEPTNFPITFISSLFKTKDTGTVDDTGFHVAQLSEPTTGSTVSYDNRYSQFDLNIEIEVILSDVVLETDRFPIMSLEVMAVVIVSTIVSIVGAIEVSMRIIEGYAVRQKHNERKANLKYHELTKLENVSHQIETVPSFHRRPQHTLSKTSDQEPDYECIDEEAAVETVTRSVPPLKVRLSGVNVENSQPVSPAYPSLLRR